MTREERDKLIRLEVQMRNLERHIDERFDRVDAAEARHRKELDAVKTCVGKLEKQSWYGRIGLLTLVGLGGLIAWLLDVANNAKDLIK